MAGEDFSGDDLFDDIDLDQFDSGDELFHNVDVETLLENRSPAERRKRDAEDDAQYPDRTSSKRQKSVQPEVHAEHLALAERLLSENFGFKAFRHEQAAAIQHLLASDNTLVVFPTGAGKSLCYQVRSSLEPCRAVSFLSHYYNSTVNVVARFLQ